MLCNRSCGDLRLQDRRVCPEIPCVCLDQHRIHIVLSTVTRCRKSPRRGQREWRVVVQPFVVVRVRWARGGGHVSMPLGVSQCRMLKRGTLTKGMLGGEKGGKEAYYWPTSNTK